MDNTLADLTEEIKLEEFKLQSDDLERVFRYFKSYDPHTLLLETQKLLLDKKIQGYYPFVNVVRLYAYSMIDLNPEQLDEFIKLIQLPYLTPLIEQKKLVSLCVQGMAKLNSLENYKHWIQLYRYLNIPWLATYCIKKIKILIKKFILSEKNPDNIVNILNTLEPEYCTQDVLEIVSIRVYMIYKTSTAGISENIDQLNKIKEAVLLKNYDSRIFNLMDFDVCDNCSFYDNFPKRINNNTLTYCKLSIFEAASLELEFEYIKRNRQKCFLTILDTEKEVSDGLYTLKIITEPFSCILSEEIKKINLCNYSLSLKEFQKILNSFEAACECLEALNIDPSYLKSSHFILTTDQDLKLYKANIFKVIPNPKYKIMFQNSILYPNKRINPRPHTIYEQKLQ